MNGYKYLMHSADIAMTEEEKEEEKQNESKLDRWLDEHAGPKVTKCADDPFRLRRCSAGNFSVYLSAYVPDWAGGKSDPHGALAAGHLGSSAQTGNLLGYMFLCTRMKEIPPACSSTTGLSTKRLPAMRQVRN